MGVPLLCCALLFAGLCCGDMISHDTAPVLEQSNNSLAPEHVALVATACTTVGVVVLATIGLVAFKGKVSMSHLLLVMVFVCITVMGILSWAITYTKMRDEVQYNVQALLLATGNEVRLSVMSLLQTGPTMSQLHKNVHTNKLATTNASFPVPVLYLHTIREAYLGSDDALTLLYYGNIYGYMFAVELDNPAADPTTYYGFPASAPASEHSMFKCRGWDNPSASCSSRTCETGASSECGGTCAIYNTTNCYSNQGRARMLGYTSPWGDPYPVGNVKRALNYDCRERPWFTEGLKHEGIHWMEPYVFIVGDDAPVVGFSSTLMVRNAAGTPEAVIAVDYKLTSVHKVLLKLPPTANSAVYLCGLNGTLYSSSLSAKASIRTSADGGPPYHVENVLVHPNPRIQKLFESIVQRVGSLTEASSRRRLLQFPGCTVLITPISMTGGLEMLVVIEVPDSDILDDVNTSSTLALVLVLVISFVIASMVSAMMCAVLAQVNRLSRNMHRVAWMQVDGSQAAEGAPSIVTEIRSMQESFALLVKNMLEYKQYLPHSLQAGDCVDTAADSEPTAPSTLGVITGPASQSKDGSVCSRSSRGSRSSSRSSSRDSARAETRHQPPASLFDKELNKRRVTILCCNWRGTHSRLSHSFRNFAKAYRLYVECVLASSKILRGVVDYFNGDRICVTFNAVLPASQHAQKAVECAATIREDEGRRGGRVAQGISSGKGMCGNAGCAGLKKFHVIGPVAGAAHALERCATQWDHDVVVGDQVASHVSAQFRLQTVRRVLLPQTSSPCIVRAVRTPLRPFSAEEDWMAAQETPKDDPYGAYNGILALLFEGSVEAARRKLASSVGLLDAGQEEELKCRVNSCNGGAEAVYDPNCIGVVAG